MLSQALTLHLTNSEKYFNRSTDCLTQDDSSYRPTEDQMTVAQHVAHVGMTIDWFLEGAFGDGFDMDFEAHLVSLQEITSLSEARASLAASFDKAREAIASKSREELMAPLPEGPVMGGAPLSGIIHAMDEHAAHHRGALTVYSRMLGKTPAMPYM